MNKILFTILLATITISTIANSKDTSSQNTGEIFVEDQVDKTPLYQGKRLPSSKMWFLTNLKDLSHYSDITFTIKFVIEKDGSISTIETIDGNKRVSKAVEKALKKDPPKYSPAMKDGNPVRYSISYDISLVYENQFKKITVENKESYIHNIKDINELPKLADGSPILEYVDSIVAAISPKIDNIKDMLRFNLIYYKDGTMSIAYLKGFPDARSAKLITHKVGEMSTIRPALKDGRPVNYVSKHNISADRLKNWHELSFKDEAKQRVENNTPFDIRLVEVLPSYNGSTLDTFYNAANELIAQNIEGKRGAKREAKFIILLGRDGKIQEIEIVTGTDDEIVTVAIEAIKQLSVNWSPAEIYGKKVSCNIFISISLPGK